MDIEQGSNASGGSAKAGLKKRSSLKTADSISKGELEQLQQRCKRLSVNWDKSINFKSVKLKSIKTSFEEMGKKGDDMKAKLFDEKRRDSIKNEFSLVRELMKNGNIDEEDEEDENAVTIKENTRKNVEFGKQREEFSDSCSNSDDNNDNDSGNVSEEN